MAKKGIMSNRLKEEIAKELGFYDVVEREGRAVLKLVMQEIWSSVQLNWPSKA